jgi:hypothetical protein
VRAGISMDEVDFGADQMPASLQQSTDLKRAPLRNMPAQPGSPGSVPFNFRTVRRSRLDTPVPALIQPFSADAIRKRSSDAHGTEPNAIAASGVKQLWLQCGKA